MNKKVILFIFLGIACFYSCTKEQSETSPPKIIGQKEYLKACQLVREGELEKAKSMLLQVIEKYGDLPIATQANIKLEEIYKTEKTVKISNQENLSSKINETVTRKNEKLQDQDFNSSRKPTKSLSKK